MSTWLPAAVAQRLAPTFPDELKRALEALPPGTLPLGRTGPNGGAVDDRGIVVMVHGWSREGANIRADIGVFYSEVVGGCSCGDEPASLPAHALVRVEIDRDTGAMRFTSR